MFFIYMKWSHILRALLKRVSLDMFWSLRLIYDLDDFDRQLGTSQAPKESKSFGTEQCLGWMVRVGWSCGLTRSITMVVKHFDIYFFLRYTIDNFFRPKLSSAVAPSKLTSWFMHSNIPVALLPWVDMPCGFPFRMSRLYCLEGCTIHQQDP